MSERSAESKGFFEGHASRDAEVATMTEQIEHLHETIKEAREQGRREGRKAERERVVEEALILMRQSDAAWERSRFDWHKGNAASLRRLLKKLGVPDDKLRVADALAREES